MKAKSIVRNLVLAGVVSSIACTAAWADQKTNQTKNETTVSKAYNNGNVVKELDETGVIEISSTEDGEYVIKTNSQKDVNDQIDFDNMEKVKFSKENGKIYYESKDGKKVFDEKDFNAVDANVTEDGSL